MKLSGFRFWFKITNTYASDGFHQTGNTGDTAGNVNNDNITTPINLPAIPTKRYPEVTPTTSNAAKDKDILADAATS